MQDCCDLHTHSHYSDGTDAPGAIIGRAVELGLSAVALTDHNTIAGIPEFLASARRNHVQAIAGTEISTDYGDRELHILGLFLPENHLEEISAFLEPNVLEKDRCNRLLVEGLNAAGYALNYHALCALHPRGTVNRANIAEEMAKLGYVASIKDAFRGPLSRKQPYFVSPRRIDTMEAISFLHSIGAVPVLAHPFLNLNPEELDGFLREAVPRGLLGMETHYSRFSEDATALAVRTARKWGLLQSGGSDYHGNVKPDIALGTGTGNLRVPLAFAAAMAKAIHL